MKKFVVTVLCLVMVSVLAGCAADERAKSISLQISDRDVDVEYMKTTDLTVFGTEDPHILDYGAMLSLEFTEFEPFETDDRLYLVSGTGELEIYGRKCHFLIDEEIMSKVEVSETNTVYESILGSTVDIEDEPLEINIDFVAAEDFSQAVATVSAEGGMLFFGDIFNDYLEYFNMVLAGVQQ